MTGRIPETLGSLGAIARTTSGHSLLEFTSMDLKKLVDEVAEMLLVLVFIATIVSVFAMR